MEHIIKTVASRAQLEERQARDAVAVFLKFIREEADADSVRALFGRLPGADELADAAPASALAGGLAGLLGRLGGDSLSSAMSALATLKTLGLSTTQIKQTGKTLYQQLSEHGDAALAREIVGQLRENVPGLERLLRA